MVTLHCRYFDVYFIDFLAPGATWWSGLASLQTCVDVYDFCQPVIIVLRRPERSNDSLLLFLSCVHTFLTFGHSKKHCDCFSRHCCHQS